MKKMCNAKIFLHLTWIHFFVIQPVSSYSIAYNNTLRLRRQTNSCLDDIVFELPFLCKSGECINAAKRCDGIADCTDSSDETTNCKSITCLSSQFTCKYGACITRNLTCDGTNNCIDGSDEEPSACQKPTTPTRAQQSCYLPPDPQFGKVYIIEFTVPPKNSVPPGSSITVVCNNGYKLEGNNISRCTDGSWSSNVGQCLRVCPQRFSNPTTKITCIYKNAEIENCTNAFEGTMARYECADYHEDLRMKRRGTHVCHNGEWNQPEPKCRPICGRKNADATTLIIDGAVVKRGAYPWQVALYSKKDTTLECGGSLLTQKMILTAAHCVTDLKGKKLPKENYIVAVGKYYRLYNDTRDSEDAQFSELGHIYVDSKYKGDTQNHLGDIAILRTKTIFELSKRVQPVCFDLGKNFNIPPNARGVVLGWGFTIEDGKPSEILKELEVPIIPYDQCESDLPDTHQVYFTNDKLCAGYLDKERAVCRGDSGGGLVLKHGTRYYVTGIVSLSPTSPTSLIGGCSRNQYALYTKVSDYNEFIQTTMTENLTCNETKNCVSGFNEGHSTYPKSPTPTKAQGSCDLPPDPQFGKIFVTEIRNGVRQGNSVPPGSSIMVDCNDGYKLEGNNILRCADGAWSSGVGQCLRLCPQRFSNPTVKIICIYKNAEIENCTDAFEGTRARYECADYHEDFGMKRRGIHVCHDGEWDQPEPKCRPICGRKNADATTLIIDGAVVKRGDYPWQVALYSKSDKTLLCSGSLLTQKMILTAAHCVTNEKGKKLPKEDYIVAVGKYYRLYNDTRDSEDSQFSELAQIYVDRKYKGQIQNYVGDIAILITKTTFKLSKSVQPVCFDSSQNFNIPPNARGVILGWGFTIEHSKPSEMLKELEVPIIPLEHCESSLPEDYEIFLTADKFCAGYLDKGKAGCKGDSGGGFVLKHGTRYYITGIFSLQPAAATALGGCDRNQYGLYTKVGDYKEFIQMTMVENKI